MPLELVDAGPDFTIDLVPGTGAADLGKATGNVYAFADAGVLSIAVRKDNATDLSTGDGKYGPLQIDPNGRLYSQVLVNAVAGDSGDAAVWAGSKIAAVGDYVFTGTTWDRKRGASGSRTVSASASGSTALFTPTTGKKFRILSYVIEVTSNASLAAGAVLVIKLLDSAADINHAHSVFVPTTAVTTGGPSLLALSVDLGQGILSGLANNVLNVNLSAALATGACRITAMVCEE